MGVTTDPKTIVAGVDSNAVSIFVDILVELKRTPLLLSRVRNKNIAKGTTDPRVEFILAK